MKNRDFQKRLIFIFDKHKPWREFSRQVLKTAGFIVKEFSSYEKFRIVQPNVPDLVIVGFAKATSTEIELIKKVRRSNVPLLALSSFLSGNEMRILFLAGADDVAEKPFNQQSLVNAVSESFNNISIKDENKLKEYIMQ